MPRINPRIDSKTEQEMYEYLRDHVRLAAKVHKEKVINWGKKIIKEYAGENTTDADTGERYTQIAQVIMSVEETVQPHLYFKNPEFYAKAKRTKSEWEAREPLIAELVNQEYKNIGASGYGIELENELVILDARLLPFGVTETCWEAEGELYQEPQNGLIDQAKSLLTGETPQMPSAIPLIDKEYHYTERVDPFKILLDHRVDHITKQGYIVKVINATRQDLQKPRYDQEAVAKLTPSVSLVPDYDSKTNAEKKDLDENENLRGYRLYEIEDIENRCFFTIADGYDGFLEYAAPHFLPEGSKYSFCWFIERPNGVYPEPPIKYYRKRANEFSYIYSAVSEQIDKFLPKIGIDITALDAPEKEKFKNGSLGTFVGFNGPPNGRWGVLQPNVQADLFKYMAMTKELLNLESGASDTEMMNPPDERTATQENKIDRGVRSRRFKPQKRVKGFVLSQAHKIYHTLLKNADLDYFVKALGPDAAISWWNDPLTGKMVWTDDQLNADCWFDYDVEEAAPQDMTLRKAENTKALETVMNPMLRQLLIEERKQLLVSPIFEKYVRENLGIRDINKVIAEVDPFLLAQEQAKNSPPAGGRSSSPRGNAPEAPLPPSPEASLQPTVPMIPELSQGA